MLLLFALWVNIILAFGLAFSYYVCCLSKMLVFSMLIMYGILGFGVCFMFCALVVLLFCIHIIEMESCDYV